MTKEEEAYVLARCKEMQAGAEEANMARCIEGEAVFYLAYERALLPGHIRSESGIAEFKISKACEYHFDKWFGGEEESPALWDADTKSVVGPRFGLE